ncbi:hypothetical protein JAO78_005010 [Alishewanella sp. 16-MA]|uniref:Uncharacterized protein n=1 Tax=Alishewanella maricola TaxID=2795740 RepID=A0ABS8C210_9ALTE|nr:hypothetical protein [Alishewanella maricola]MCB5226170.1 hypothetical protein [Alishewanella maricola]
MSNTPIKPPGIYKRYWHAYGGTKALIKSPYLWLAFFVSLLLFRIWTVPGWWDHVFSIVPSLLGFSLGGFALWIAIGDDSFRKFIAEKETAETVSIYSAVNANFVHFILLQVISIFAALIAKAANFTLPAGHFLLQKMGECFYLLTGAFSFLGFLVFVYALLSTLAAVMGLLRVTYMYELYINSKKN